MKGSPTVATLVDQLGVAYGAPVDALQDPYAMILHENAGYLIDDARRDAVYARLVAVAPTPEALLRASTEALMAIARDGGMRPDERIARWRDIALLTLAEADGDLAGVLRASSRKAASRFLRRYPVIGEPGADRILLFGGFAAVPALDSNGLRALERYGFVRAGTAYAAQYRAAAAHLGNAFGDDAAALRRAYIVLRRHGKAVCRRNSPACATCAVRSDCSYALALPY